MKEPNIRRVIMGNKDISPWGYSYIAVRNSHELIDEIHVISPIDRIPEAEATAFLIKAYGYQEKENSPIEEKKILSKCEKCNKLFSQKINTCKICNSVCKEIHTKNVITILEPIGALKAWQEKIVSLQNKDILSYIDICKQKQYIGDLLILNKIESFSQK